MTLIKTLSNGRMQIAIYKLVSGEYRAYIVRTKQEGGNEFIVSSICLDRLEALFLNGGYSKVI